MRTVQTIFKEIEDVPDFIGHTITHVNYRNGWGDTPLHVVSIWGDCEAIRLLIAAGADINDKGEDGFTPLHYAVEHENIDAVKLLLEFGAVMTENNDGMTPLEIAEMSENNELILLLRK